MLRGLRLIYNGCITCSCETLAEAEFPGRRLHPVYSVASRDTGHRMAQRKSFTRNGIVQRESAWMRYPGTGIRPRAAPDRIQRAETSKPPGDRLSDIVQVSLSISVRVTRDGTIDGVLDPRVCWVVRPASASPQSSHPAHAPSSIVYRYRFHAA